jgi:hypothetical protein
MKPGVTHRGLHQRVDAFIMTVIAIAMTTAIVLLVQRSASAPPPAPIAQPALPVLPPPLPALAEVNVLDDLPGRPAAAPRATRRSRAGVPLDAAVNHQPDGYEILSAAELEAISQAPQ